MAPQLHLPVPASAGFPILKNTDDFSLPNDFVLQVEQLISKAGFCESGISKASP
jgi:hypothetical protein